ncbi:hypothetical protein BN1263440025 [Stenotrophomonas indicatrix]|nr:hypothetical protein BN1263440025 [Stenotrophomonas indicatrix]
MRQAAAQQCTGGWFDLSDSNACPSQWRPRKVGRFHTGEERQVAHHASSERICIAATRQFAMEAGTGLRSDIAIVIATGMGLTNAASEVESSDSNWSLLKWRLDFLGKSVMGPTWAIDTGLLLKP